jgi:replicative DNA helicase
MVDISLEKTLPNNLEAERAILGAILIDCAVPADIRVSDFYLDSHRRIMACLQALAERGEPLNLISVKNYLQINNELESVGGPAYLAGLTDGLPRLELAPQYYRIIRRDSALRRLIQMGNEAMSLGYMAEEEPQEIISKVLDYCDEANSILDESTGLVSIGELVSPVFKEIEARSDNKATDAFPTGFKDVDRILAGGIRPTNSVTIGGRPGHGKTAFMTQMLINMAKTGTVCALFELEMSIQEIIERMICQLGRVDGARLRTGFLNKEDWNRITRAAGDLCSFPIYIDDSTGIGVADIRSRIRKAQQKYKIKFNICGIDYLQLLSPSKSMRKNADENAQTAEISKSLKFMAKSMNMGVIPVSQLSRSSEKRKDRTPQLSDLRNSGQIEQDADVVLFVYREEISDPTEENAGISKIIIAKQRNGPTGEIDLAFTKQFTCFDNLYQEG